MENLKDVILEREVPRHVAIIMDGNGRWAKKRNYIRTKGHLEGMERVIEVVESSLDIGIKNLTLFAFSTENWKRPEVEIVGLMNILVTFIDRELGKLVDNGVRLNIMGDISKLPKKPRKAIEVALRKTNKNTKMILNIALNYGGQVEIIKGVKDLFKDIKRGIIDIDDINEENFNEYLYTKNQPYPDLLIRPSGELRISNFMLYQIAYTEFYFSNILWPDFGREDFYKAIIEYQNRNRRFGGI